VKRVRIVNLNGEKRTGKPSEIGDSRDKSVLQSVSINQSVVKSNLAPNLNLSNVQITPTLSQPEQPSRVNKQSHIKNINVESANVLEKSVLDYLDGKLIGSDQPLRTETRDAYNSNVSPQKPRNSKREQPLQPLDKNVGLNRLPQEKPSRPQTDYCNDG